MEKVFLKPTSREIVIKGNSNDGHTDVFAYDYYNDDGKRKLGSLFMVGNVRRKDAETANKNTPDSSSDIAYVTNLIASLAKREYYSRPDTSPRDAFAATLKKINSVVEEFFKNKELKVNMGIFAVAGEQILISKLGKFKIILGRESRTIDILNNIDLFNKEHVEEKEFSNIISGKVASGDKLFAFYPSRPVTAREKFIKISLLKFSDDKFVEKINSIREVKPDFNCGALYLSLNKHKEPTVAKQSKPAVTGVSGNVGPTLKEESDMPRKDAKNQPPANIESEKPEPSQTWPEPSQEVPRIISSEFSLGKKTNPLLIPMKIIRNLYLDSGSFIGNLANQRLSRNINLKRKAVILSLTAGILIIGVAAVKKFIVINPEQRQLNAVISQAQNNLKLARTKISQNDFIGARQLLADSLSSVHAVGATNDRTEKTTDEVYELLDNVDKAVDTSPSLLETMPDDLNQAISISTAQKEKLNTNQYNIASPVAFNIYENNLYILTPDNIFKITDINQNNKKEAAPWLKSGNLPFESSMIAVDGNIYVMNRTGALATYYKGERVSETNTFIVSGSGDVLLASKESDKLYLVNKFLSRIYELDKESGSLIRTLKVGSSEPFVDAYLAGDRTIIITTKDGRIWEIK